MAKPHPSLKNHSHENIFEDRFMPAAGRGICCLRKRRNSYDRTSESILQKFRRVEILYYLYRCRTAKKYHLHKRESPRQFFSGFQSGKLHLYIRQILRHQFRSGNVPNSDRAYHKNLLQQRISDDRLRIICPADKNPHGLIDRGGGFLMRYSAVRGRLRESAGP